MRDTSMGCCPCPTGYCSLSLYALSSFWGNHWQETCLHLAAWCQSPSAFRQISRAPALNLQGTFDSQELEQIDCHLSQDIGMIIKLCVYIADAIKSLPWFSGTSSKEESIKLWSALWTYMNCERTHINWDLLLSIHRGCRYPQLLWIFSVTLQICKRSLILVIRRVEVKTISKSTSWLLRHCKSTRPSPFDMPKEWHANLHVLNDDIHFSSYWWLLGWSDCTSSCSHVRSFLNRVQKSQDTMPWPLSWQSLPLLWSSQWCRSTPRERHV